MSTQYYAPDSQPTSPQETSPQPTRQQTPGQQPAWQQPAWQQPAWQQDPGQPGTWQQAPGQPGFGQRSSWQGPGQQFIWQQGPAPQAPRRTTPWGLIMAVGAAVVIGCTLAIMLVLGHSGSTAPGGGTPAPTSNSGHHTPVNPDVPTKAPVNPAVPAKPAS